MGDITAPEAPTGEAAAAADVNEPVTTETATEVVEEPASPAPPESPRRYTVKVDGEELEVEEPELLKGYSRGSASAKRFQEAARLRKEVEGILESLKDPYRLPEVLQQLGVDPSDVYRTWTQEAQQWESMSEEERAKVELNFERQKLEAEKKTIEDQRTQERIARETAQAHRQYMKEFDAAFETAGLPKTPQTIALMAQHMEAALESGYELTAGDAAELVKEQFGSIRKTSLEGLTPEEVEATMGQSWMNTLRKWDVERLQAKAPGKAASKPKPPSLPKKRARVPIVTADQFSNWLRSGTDG